MSNCCLLQTNSLSTGLKKTLEMPQRKPALRDVTPAFNVTPELGQQMETVGNGFLPVAMPALLPAVMPNGLSKSLTVQNRQLVPAPRLKTKRAYKKSTAQAFVELMLAAGSLLFLALT